MIEKNILSNNIPVILDINKSIESVFISMWFKAGSNNEEDNNNGIAHFLEHMAFKSTKNRTTQQIAQEFDSIGGIFNAYTSRESTIYYMKILKHDLEKAVSIMSDMILNPLLLQEEIEKEREVILQEFASYQDNPDELVYDKFFECAYDKQSFGKNILGTIENIKNFTREDFIKFIDNYYNIDNMFFVISGNLDTTKTLNFLENYFQDMKKSSNKSVLYDKKPYYKSKCYLEQKKLEQAYLMLGFESVQYSENQDYSFSLLADIFGGGMSSILFQEIREKLGLVYGISCSSINSIHTGCFVINCSTTGNNIIKLIPELFEQINILPKYDKEKLREKLEISKRSIISSIEMGWENSQNRALIIGNHYRKTNNIFNKNILLSNIKHVDIIKIQEIINKIIDSNKFTISAIGNIHNLMSFETLKKYIHTT